MRRQILLQLLAMATAVSALCFAGEPSQAVHLRGQASGLKPGTQVSADFGLEYQLVDVRKAVAGQRAGASAPEDDAVVSRVPATERHRWEFVVPKNGIVPEKRMAFRVDVPADKTPDGIDELIFFPVTYTITVPSEPDQPPKTMTRTSTVGGLRSRFDKEACFRFQLFDDGYYAVGLAEDCDKPMKHPKEAGIPDPHN